MLTIEDLRLDASHHIYLLPHKTAPKFAIASATLNGHREQHLRRLDVNIDKGIALQFVSSHVHAELVPCLRKAALPFVVESDKPGKVRWYDIACLTTIYVMARNNEAGKPDVIMPFRVLVPEDADEALAIIRAEKAWHEEIADRKKSKILAAVAKEKAERKAIWDKIYESARANGRWITRAGCPRSAAEQIVGFISEINQLSNGYCRLVKKRAGGLEFAFSVKSSCNEKIQTILAELYSFIFAGKWADGELSSALGTVTPVFQQARRPSYLPYVAGVVAYTVQVTDEINLFDDVFLDLKPEIRGWDLPSSTSVRRLGNTSTDSSEKRARLSIGAQAMKAWREALKDCPAELGGHLVQRFPSLKWQPPAIRYLVSSPFAEDEGAPLLLARLTAPGGVSVGFQKVRLDNGRIESVYFSEPYESAYVGMWQEKPCMLFVLSLDDALELNARMKLPATVVPTSEALANYQLAEDIESVTIYLPSGSSEQFIDAAHKLMARAKSIGATVRCRVPNVQKSRGWAGHIRAFDTFDEALDASVELDSFNPLPLQEVLPITVLPG